MDFLSTWGERLTESFSIRVGNGMGPETRAPERFGGFNDLQRRLIDHSIVEALEFDANALTFHGRQRTRIKYEQALGVGFDNLGEQRIRNLLEMRRSDARALARPFDSDEYQSRNEKKLERNVGGDDARARFVFHALDLTAATVISPMRSPWYSSGVVTSTAMIGSRRMVILPASSRL